MGSSEMDKAPKEESKTAQPISQERSSTTCAGTVNPEWSSFQAYSPIPPHAFLASSPQSYVGCPVSLDDDSTKDEDQSNGGGWWLVAMTVGMVGVDCECD